MRKNPAIEKMILDFKFTATYVADQLIMKYPNLDKDDLEQQGILILAEMIQKGDFPYPITNDRQIACHFINHIMKELTVYADNINNYLNRKVRCNSTSNESEKRYNKLFEESENNISKEELFKIVYAGGETNKGTIITNVINYLVGLGICPNYNGVVILSDETIDNVIEMIAEYLM